jgi:HlyD family secretion protein
VDVIRKHSKARRGFRLGLISIVVVGLLGAGTAGVSLLEPALPEIDRSTVIVDTVQRGTMVRQVLGSGTLVPVDVTWVTAEVGGQVLEVFVEPGIDVTPDKELIKLQDQQLDRAVRDAERDVEAAKAELERFKLQQQSLQYDLKVAIATARANYEEAREQAEIDETMARRGLKSPRQWQFSLDRAERNQMLFEVQLDRAANSVKTLDIQLEERNDAIERAKDRLAERRELQEALIVKAGTDGVLQQLGLAGNGLEVGQRVAPGAVVAKISNPTQLKAVIFVSQVQARDVVAGQPATIDTHNGLVEGRVTRVDPQVLNDRVSVDVELIGGLPPGARPDLSVEGLIEVARLEDVLHVRKPVYSQENGRLEIFRLHGDDTIASRATVEFGCGTVHSIEVTAGLQEGDRIVVSDTTRWKSFDMVRLR